MNLPLLAQQATANPAWAALRDSMRKQGDFTRTRSLDGLGTVVAIAAAVILLVWVVQRLRSASSRSKSVGAPPKRLFTLATQWLGICFIDRVILMRAAYASRLDHPTLMLLTPQLLEEHAGEWADRFPIWSLRRVLRARVNQMSRDIFGDTPAEMPTSPAPPGNASVAA